MRSRSGFIAGLAAFACASAVLPEGTPRWLTLPNPPPLPKAEQAGYAAHRGAKLYFAVFNARGGRPVILLHGGMGSSDFWGFEVPKLAATHEVIVIDSRGHGHSTMGDGPLSYALMADDVIAVMDRLRLAKTSVVGISDGGIIGLILAIDHPSRVDKLLAWGASFNTNADPTTPPDPRFQTMGPAFMAMMAANYRAESPTPKGFSALKSALGAMYAKEPDLAVAELARIRAPTIIADGDHEQFVAPEHTALLAKSIPGARLVTLPDTSHAGPDQDPEGFHRIVASLLD